jgi:hypothetical protein
MPTVAEILAASRAVQAEVEQARGAALSPTFEDPVRPSQILEDPTPTPAAPNSSPQSPDSGTRLPIADLSRALTYADTRTMALEVFSANYMRMSRQAAVIAVDRAESFTNLFLQQFEEGYAGRIDSARDPDMQRAIFTVQMEFARTGDPDLRDLLVDWLVDRAGETERSLMQIVLNEALSASAKLAPDQFDALSLIFLLRYTRQLDLQSPTTLYDYIDRLWAPFSDTARRGRPSFQHLQYTGCGSAGGSGSAIEESLAQRCPLLFCKGFTRAEATKVERHADALGTLLVPPFHNERR